MEAVTFTTGTRLLPTRSNFALSGSCVPGVGTPAAAAAAAGEGPSPTAQQLHSLQPHSTVRDLTQSPATATQLRPSNEN